jgi:pSer/pThr/pTyr-binding forkhead associated (FHA) protein
MHHLTIEDSAGAVVVVPLLRDRISVGRGAGNVVRLTDQNVSRRHARLVRHEKEGRFVVEDLASQLGTLVNGRPIAGPTVLAEGDEVTIGDYRLAVKDARPSPVRAWARTAGEKVRQKIRKNAGDLSARVESFVASAARALSPENVAAAATGAGTMALCLPMMTDDPEIPVTPSRPALPPPVSAEPPAAAATPATPAPVSVEPPEVKPAVSAEPAPSPEVLSTPGPVPVRIEEPPPPAPRPVPSLLASGEIRTPSPRPVPSLAPRPLPAPVPSTAAFEALSRSLTAPLSQPYVDPRARRRRARVQGTLVLAGVAAVMVIVGALFAPLLRRDAARPAAPVVAVPSRPVPPVAAPSGPALLAEARKAYRQQRWSEALLTAERAVPLLPGSRELQDLRRAIVAEHQNQSTLQTLSRALDLEDYRAVLRGAATIPLGSVYRERAVALSEAARANLVVQHLTAGERSRAEGDCGAAQKQAESALALEAQNPGALALIASCEQAAVVIRPAPRRVRVAAIAAPPVDQAPRKIVQRQIEAAPAVAPIPAQPPERGSRRPIDPNNPYAADLP